MLIQVYLSAITRIRMNESFRHSKERYGRCDTVRHASRRTELPLLLQRSVTAPSWSAACTKNAGFDEQVQELKSNTGHP